MWLWYCCHLCNQDRVDGSGMSSREREREREIAEPVWCRPQSWAELTTGVRNNVNSVKRVSALWLLTLVTTSAEVKPCCDSHCWRQSEVIWLWWFLTQLHGHVNHVTPGRWTRRSTAQPPPPLHPCQAPPPETATASWRMRMVRILCVWCAVIRAVVNTMDSSHVKVSYNLIKSDQANTMSCPSKIYHKTYPTSGEE